MLFINFKTYESGTGEKALLMAKLIERVSRDTGREISVVVQAGDVLRVAREVLVPVWVQHVDGIEYGAHSGWVLPESVKENGAVGVVLNHSERKVDFKDLERTVKRCRDVGLKILLCVGDIEEAEQLLELDSDYLAYEPPALIGGKVSVSAVNANVVSEIVAIAGQEPVLIGAGVHEAEDIRRGLELGASGFLVASGIMKADNPENELREMIKGFNGL